MEAVEEKVPNGSVEEVESEEEEEEKEEAGQNPVVEQLQSEVEELRRQLAEIEREKEAVMKMKRNLEDRQVKNWKLIQEATKFSGLLLFYFHWVTNSKEK